MKGFTKDGKFRPTGKRNKSSLKKTDVKRKEVHEDFIVMQDKNGKPISQAKYDKWLKGINTDKKTLDSSNKFTMEDYDANLSAWEVMNGGDIRNALELAKKYGTKSEVADMESMLYSYESTGNTWNYEYDEMNKIDSKYYYQLKAHQEIRNKEQIGSHAGHPLVIEDNGKLYEEFPDHDEEVFKQPQSIDHHRHKFSLFGDKKSDQAKASEERIKNEEKTQQILEKQDNVQDKNNQKRAKEIAHHIKFLEKHMEGLEKKPAKYGVNANTQLENIQESRDQKRDLQAELDEINKLLEHPQIRHKKGNRTNHIGKFTNPEHHDEMRDILPIITAKEYSGRDKKSFDDKDSRYGRCKVCSKKKQVGHNSICQDCRTGNK